MHPLLKPRGKAFLIGNHAVVRGALEAGVGFTSSYPGTPASDIGDSFAELAKEAGIYFEWSTNEKVATEAAAAAALSGVRSLVSFKHFGWNVASDSIYPLAFIGVKAGMVIAMADDPGCWSSGQSEQDSRYLARVAHLPLLEPSDAVECRDMIKLAFELSEATKLPVILRMTTRVSHAGAIVKLSKLVKGRTTGSFSNDIKWNTMPPRLLQVHRELHEKMQKAAKLGRKLNFSVPGHGKFGIVTSGVSYRHVLEAMETLGTKVPVLKLGMTWPTPEDIITKFIRPLKTVLVVEELEPVLQLVVERLAKDVNPKLVVEGKNHLSRACELNPTIVTAAIAEHVGKRWAAPRSPPAVPTRPPVLCPGCPHRATFWAAKTAAPKGTVFGGDIGCYILGIYPPLETQDFIISMGAAQGFTHGIRKVSKQPAIAFIGDSTFFHAGIPGLINQVWNKSDPLVMALDNRTTAMTGHQPTPGIGITAMGEQTKALKIEDIATACGVDNVNTVNCFDVAATQAAIKGTMAKPGTKLLVTKGECRLLFMRRMRKQGVKVPTWQINQSKCTKCGVCVFKFGCPAIHYTGSANNWKKGKFWIEQDFCWGCSVCAQVCPSKAIEVKK
jgi:indolepyruvate ferredoxin oxidoreductase alpha subunit